VHLKRRIGATGVDDVMNARRYKLHGPMMLGPPVATMLHGYYSDGSN
jgi:hypothetical protein